jgi:hypothetical protein
LLEVQFREHGEDIRGTGYPAAEHLAKRNKRLCLAISSRKNTRLDCADCCTCVAVEGGQMHEGRGAGAKLTHAPLKA